MEISIQEKKKLRTTQWVWMNGWFSFILLLLMLSSVIPIQFGQFMMVIGFLMVIKSLVELNTGKTPIEFISTTYHQIEEYDRLRKFEQSKRPKGHILNDLLTGGLLLFLGFFAFDFTSTDNYLELDRSFLFILFFIILLMNALFINKKIHMDKNSELVGDALRGRELLISLGYGLSGACIVLLFFITQM